MAGQNGKGPEHDPIAVHAGELDPAIHQEVKGTHRVLRMILDLIRPTTFAIAGQGRQVRAIPDWPFPGAVRYVIPYTGLGGLITLPANTPVQLTAADGGNGIGMEIRNTGAADAVLYLTDLATFGPGTAPAVAVPAIYLATALHNGSTWDGRISGYVYAGAVVAISPTGTTLSLAAL